MADLPPYLAAVFINLLLLGAVASAFAIPAWRRRARCKNAGLVGHSRAVFSSRFQSAARQEAAAAQLDEHDLLWAHFHPDHTAHAKRIIATELSRRGVSVETMCGWRPGPRELTVPPTFQSKMPMRKYLRMVRNGKRLFGAFVYFLIALIVLIVAMIVLREVFDIPKGLSNAPWEAYLAHFGDQTTAAIFFGLDRTAFVFSILLFAVPIFAGIVHRKRALRILLLRPFGEKHMTRPLKRFVTGTLGPFGYVFTLSDRNYRPNLIVTTLLLLPVQGIEMVAVLIIGPLIRNSLRIASVKSDRTFRSLERFLLRKFRPSYWSFLSGRQAFNIRSTDAWWQTCIDMLMLSCDVIVVDLSKVKSGTAWELNQLQTRGLTDRCLFIVSSEFQPDLEATLAHHFASGTRPHVFVFDAEGHLAEAKPFADRLEAMMERAFKEWPLTKTVSPGSSETV